MATILAIFKFWDQVTWFIKLLQKTPEEKHQELMSKMETESATYAQTGRPIW